MKRLIASTVVLFAAGMAFVVAPSAAGLVDAPAPLRVKVAPLAGPKVKVAKKLKVVVSCSKQCRLKMKFTLVTPGLSDSVKGGTSLAPQSPFITGMVLSGFGKNLLKNSYRQSRLKVNINALDVATGKRSSKTRSFKFTR